MNGAGERNRASGPFVLLLFGLSVAISLFFGFHFRLRAWPEVLVPGYLGARGWLLYRDVKFAHAPLFPGFLSLVARTIGFSPSTLRALGLAPLALVLGEIAWLGASKAWSRLAIGFSMVYLVSLYFLWDCYAVYTDVWLAPLALPLYALLGRSRARDLTLAGILCGVGLTLKQPVVIVFFVGVVWIAFHTPRRILRFALPALVAPLLAVALFAASGALSDLFLWTVVMPLRYYRGRSSLPIGAAQLRTVAVGLIPVGALIAARLRPASGERPALLALLAAGFAALAVPRFALVHLAAVAPLAAYAAGLAFSSSGETAGARSDRRLGLLRPAAAVLALLLNAAQLSTDPAAGEITYWSSVADDRTTSALARLPRGPLFLYGPDQNIFIRSGRVPPGRLYNNPDLWIHYLADDLESRQIDVLRRHPQTLVLRSGTPQMGDGGRRLERYLETEYRDSGSVAGGSILLRPLLGAAAR